MAQDNLLAPDVLNDPYAYFAHLRETDPVHWNERWGGWLILRYDDVVKVFRRLYAERFPIRRMVPVDAHGASAGEALGLLEAGQSLSIALERMDQRHPFVEPALLQAGIERQGVVKAGQGLFRTLELS